MYDWWRRWNFNQDLAFFKNWHGTHNFKFGYGFMHGTADELPGAYNTSDVYVAYNTQYVPNSPIGTANCQKIVAQNTALYGNARRQCRRHRLPGNWGTVNLRDLISASGKVGGWNHSFYVQDAWTVSKRLTLNVGLRMDKENLPSYNPDVSGHQLRMGRQNGSARWAPPTTCWATARSKCTAASGTSSTS